MGGQEDDDFLTERRIVLLTEERANAGQAAEERHLGAGSGGRVGEQTADDHSPAIADHDIAGHLGGRFLRIAIGVDAAIGVFGVNLEADETVFTDVRAKQQTDAGIEEADA